MTNEQQRIAVVGVGAIGGAVAADLADLGRHEVVLCTRTPFAQLVVRHPAGVSKANARVLAEPAEASPVDWVLLATKAYQSEDARPWLDALCGPETRVAVLQNGVDHVERIAPLVPGAASVLPVVVQLPAEKTGPGEVEQANHGVLFVPDEGVGQAFAALFAGARARVKPTAEFAMQAWWKLLMNAALGGVCALAIRENGAVEEPALRELTLALMREILPVARAEGAAVPDDAPEKALRMVLGAAGDHWSSITIDRREGRPMEWRVRNEVVGRVARRHGIATPLNDAITALLAAADELSG
ncbi:MAG: 2-dehydropantoate 2-reductase [Myxococcota bacterium]|nr:2-dehydropantoate 2-reductase [Myxococcota bacterium]